MIVPSEDGHWISEDFARLSEVIVDYDPRFELRWIPPESRETREDRAKPFCVWDTLTNSAVLLASENDTPAQILARLWRGDPNKQGGYDNILKQVEAEEQAQKALDMKARIEEEEEKMEYAAWLMATKKNFINLGNGRKVDSQLRPLN